MVEVSQAGNKKRGSHMNTVSQNAIIIGANYSALIATRAISDCFEDIVILEQRSEFELSTGEQELVRELESNSNSRFVFNVAIRAYLYDDKGNIIGVQVYSSGESSIIHSCTIIDSIGTQFSAHHVPYSEQKMLHTVAVQSYAYHKMERLPRGLYVIGDALSNIGQVTGQSEQLAQIQSILLKKYLTSAQSNLKFQKNVARIISIVMKDYLHSAHRRAGIERQLETRGFATATQ